MIDILWGQVAWVSGVLLVAATIQGVAGFGFMLVATAGLIQIYPAQLVVPGLALVYIPLGIAQFFQVRKQIDWRLLATWMVGATLGLLPGTYVLTILDSADMKRGIGLAMVVLAGLLQLRPGSPIRNDLAVRLGGGILSGALGASTSIAGPPLVLAGIKQRWDVQAFRASLWAYFTVLSIVIVVLQTNVGIVTMDTVWWSASGLPGIGLGFVTATLVRGRVSDEGFRKLGVLLVLAGGVVALVF